MLPHSNFGIRVRRAKSKGYFWNKPKPKHEHKEEQATIHDEGSVAGVSDFFKGLLRGGKKPDEKKPE